MIRDEDRAKGGLARAMTMTPEQRAESARKASEARWGIPKATHEDELVIGTFRIPCAVLDDGPRVLSERGLSMALGHVRSGSEYEKKGAADDGEKLPVFLQSNKLKPFISEKLAMALSKPILYRSKKGGRPSHGIPATVLLEICEVFLEARAAGVLTAAQGRKAAVAETLIRSFAKVGIIALIDEATGYQADRARDELRQLLEKFVVEDMRPWAPLFPSSFFRHVFRLHGWKYEPGHTQGPRYVGKFINRYVYERLPEPVLDEIRKRNPVVGARRKHKNHQFLTEDVGLPGLDKHIASVTTLMSVAQSKQHFDEMFRMAFPAPGEGTQLALPPPSVKARDEEE